MTRAKKFGLAALLLLALPLGFALSPRVRIVAYRFLFDHGPQSSRSWALSALGDQGLVAVPELWDLLEARGEFSREEAEVVAQIRAITIDETPGRPPRMSLAQVEALCFGLRSKEQYLRSAAAKLLSVDLARSLQTATPIFGLAHQGLDLRAQNLIEAFRLDGISGLEPCSRALRGEGWRPGVFEITVVKAARNSGILSFSTLIPDGLRARLAEGEDPFKVWATKLCRDQSFVDDWLQSQHWPSVNWREIEQDDPALAFNALLLKTRPDLLTSPKPLNAAFFAFIAAKHRTGIDPSQRDRLLSPISSPRRDESGYLIEAFLTAGCVLIPDFKEAALDRARKSLDSPISQTRDNAIRALQVLADFFTINQNDKALRSEVLAVMKTLIKTKPDEAVSLFYWNDKELRSSIATHLKSDLPARRFLALESVVRLDRLDGDNPPLPEGAIAILVEGFANPDVDAWGTTLELLRDHERVPSALIPVLNANLLERQGQLDDLLGEGPFGEVLLKLAAKHPDPMVRGEAQEVLDGA